MTDDQFPGNPKMTHPQGGSGGKVEEPSRVAGPVAVGPVIIKKKGIGRKVKDLFFGGGFKDSMRWVAAELLLPGLRNVIADTGIGAVERMVRGERSSTRNRSVNYGPRVSYNNPIARQTAALPHQPPYLSRNARQEVGDIILATREEAEAVLDQLIDVIDKYRSASFGDLQELLGLPHKYTDQRWGWSFLGNAEIVQVREGFLLDLPPMEPI